MAERNSQTHRVKTDRWAVCHCTAINLPLTCLVSRRLQWSSVKWRHTLDQLSKQTPVAACQVARATELGTVATYTCGSWVWNLVRVTHLALGSHIYGRSAQPCCRLLEEGCKLKVLMDWTEVTGCVNHKCMSVPQIARHDILCVWYATYLQQHTLHVMQILCSQCCAGFATNVDPDEKFTCAVHYLLNSRAIVPNYTPQSTAREPASFSASQ